jgi:DNA-binding response OmpR family regulator
MANILLIEPDRPLAEIYQGALLKAGHNVIVCAGAQSAILSADQQKPDLIILELQLVEHSGIEFLYELRSYKDWEAIPVVIHSVVPSREFESSWHLLEEELGVIKYLFKPKTNLADLISNVNNLEKIKV